MTIVADHEYSLAQVIAEKYLGKNVQIYFGETSGYTHYSDFDIEQKTYIEGKVISAKGTVLVLECNIDTPAGDYVREVIISCWNITAIMEKAAGVQITHLFQGNNKRKRK